MAQNIWEIKYFHTNKHIETYKTISKVCSKPVGSVDLEDIDQSFAKPSSPYICL